MGRPFRLLVGMVVSSALAGAADVSTASAADEIVEALPSGSNFDPWGDMEDWLGSLCKFVPCENSSLAIAILGSDVDAAAWAFCLLYEDNGIRANMSKSQALTGIATAHRILDILDANPTKLNPIVEERLRAALEGLQEELAYSN